MGSPTNLTTLLARLAASGVDFVLVGGLAAVAQGASFSTQDVDVVHRRSAENVERLVSFLASVGACYRGRPPGQVLHPERQALLGPGHHLLQTDLGPLDVLGAIEGGRAYEDLIPDAVPIEVEGQAVRVLGLRTLVELKRDAAAPEDRQKLAVLEATLRRLTRR